MTACEAWSWAWFLGATCGAFFLGLILSSCCSMSAYSLGYEDACLDHGIVPEECEHAM